MSALADMNHVQPQGSLPLVHMHKHTTAMPARSPRPTQPRNLTGLYLGSAKRDPPPQPDKTNVPAQFARTRAMPSRRARTPAEERRYNKVEKLRVREDRRGFSGNPVKSYQRTTTMTDHMEGTPRIGGSQAGTTDFWDMTKQTNRQFTAAHNSGVSHLEYLAPDPEGTVSSFYPGAFDKYTDNTLVQEIQQANEKRKEAIGLIHCYNKICKGNRDALLTLLPSRRSQNTMDNSYRSTGFSVKSYRTPHQAEILGSFPSPAESRPRTMDMLVQNRRPLVPGPYFFKGYSPNREQSSYREHVMGIPNTGRLSQNPHSARQGGSSIGNGTPRRSPPNSQPSQKKQQQEDLSVTVPPIAPSSSPTPRTQPEEETPNDEPEVKVKESVSKVEVLVPAMGNQDETRPSTANRTATNSYSNMGGNTGDTTQDQTKDSQSEQNKDVSNAADSPKASDSGPAAPPIVIAEAEGPEDATQENNPFAGPNPETGHHINIVIKSQGRKEQLAELLNEHAEIVQNIAHTEKSATNIEATADSNKSATNVEAPAESDKSATNEAAAENKKSETNVDTPAENDKSAASVEVPAENQKSETNAETPTVEPVNAESKAATVAENAETQDTSAPPEATQEEPPTEAPSETS